MNILYAVHAYKPAYRIGGPVISVSSAAEMLAKKGHHVTVFTTSSNLDDELDVPLDQPIDVDGVEVWYFRREEPLRKWLPFVPYLSRSMGFMYAPAMKRELRRVMPRIDVVDTHMPFVYPSYAAAHAAFRFGRPLFYHQRGNFDPARLAFRGGKKRLYISLVEKPIMRRASRLIALTDAERASFRALGIVTPCDVVPNGIDIPPPRPGASERVAERWGIAPGAPLILFLGRLHPFKGAEKLLDAFARVQSELPRAVLMMAGPDEWRLEASWRDRIAREGLGDRVLFPGMLTGDDKADVLARADLFSLPSPGEGFSMAVLEALAASTAVMISPGCHFPDVEPDAGVIVDPDPDRMAEAMRQLLADPARLRAMGEAGRKLVAERYSWNAIADRLIDVYESGR
jgi:glycosyltransferase involved in cell wall biosynthesis